MDIRAEIQTRVDEIEQIIKRYLPAEEGCRGRFCEDYGTGNELQYSCRRKKTSPDVDVGDLSSVWWKIKSDRAFYGGDGDDSHLFSGAR